MTNELPQWINLLFLACFFFTIILFYISNKKSLKFIGLILVWSSIHSILAYQGFYQDTTSMPPRFLLVIVPVILIITYSLTKKFDWIKEKRRINHSSFLHFVRLPVELVLHQLFIYKMIPELMTYQGRNFDIILGITAPIIGILFYKKLLGRRALFYWNVFGLFMILFILLNSILSAELPIQQFAFDQPNRAVLYFPFVLLPATIVPLVIWTHLSDILLLRADSRTKK